MARYDDLNDGRILFVGVISVMLTFVIILGLQVVYFAMEDTADQQKLLGTEFFASDEYLASQREALNSGPAVITTETERSIHIPIDAAMTIVADEIAAQQSDDGAGDNQVTGGETNATAEQT